MFRQHLKLQIRPRPCTCAPCRPLMEPPLQQWELQAAAAAACAAPSRNLHTGEPDIKCSTAASSTRAAHWAAGCQLCSPRCPKLA